MSGISDKKIVWLGKFLRVMNITYKDSAGILRNWEAVDRVNCNGVVVIVPATSQGEVLLVRQFRPAVGGYVIEFPAGLNDRGDSLEEAAKRELLEETGFLANELTFLAEGPVSSGCSSEILTAYLAKNIEFKGLDKRDESEDIEVLKISIAELYSRLFFLRKKGNNIDLKIFGLMELAKKYL